MHANITSSEIVPIPCSKCQSPKAALPYGRTRLIQPYMMQEDQSDSHSEWSSMLKRSHQHHNALRHCSGPFCHPYWMVVASHCHSPGSYPTQNFVSSTVLVALIIPQR